MCSKTVLKDRFKAAGVKTPAPGRAFVLTGACILLAIGSGCVANNQNQNVNSNQSVANASPSSTNASQPAVSAVDNSIPVTLPVVDAMFSDESFAGEIKAKLGLTDDQIQQLQQASRDAVLQLDESDENTSTRESEKRASDAIAKIVGDEKARQVIDLVRQRWGGDESLLTGRPNSIPTDSRIVVNAPAYRMDIFRDGKLERTFKVGIGYPEFPLPRGLRKAEQIIFNPVWTPPDEPWVKGKFAPGRKVEAGSKDNPLGILKIPIGLPSLIHGGKNPAKLGTFASHGCVGLTNQQVEVFAQELAALGGDSLTMDDIKGYQKERSKTEEVKLQHPVPVELRYETIVVEDGKVYIYRDVYELGTNTEENLRKVLSVYDVDLDQLDPSIKQQLLQAVDSMAVDAKGTPVSPDDNANNKNSGSGKAKSGKITTTIKGKKEIVIDVPQLAGKGYPAAVNFMG
jgi:lipoprotein-anchoring transpeptidase ErfK/SrfK